jgi:hypothetical protein
VELRRPRAKKDSDGDVAYIIRLDTMLVYTKRVRNQLVSNSSSYF